MFKPLLPFPVRPNLWHFSALVWGISHLLLSLFAMPISFSQTGARMQIGLLLVHAAGLIYLWRLGARRGNPERLMDTALVTLLLVYLVPLCMLTAPVIVLAAYATPSPVWKVVAAILLCAAVMLACLRIWTTARSNEIGRRFEPALSSGLKDNVITADSISTLLTRIGRHSIGPTRIDGWTMIAAVMAGVPILSADISYDKSSSSLAICALVTTPMAMHTFSRMAVHAYLWIYRLARFERESGIKVVVNLRYGL
ncbi:hypothetical protein [Pseudoduganella violaceinigra]|uniref:hypothetical protein n=1 Tax=Pseudoduganella violaceinigra TaxID=246602 RepID=UPI000413B28B|nr:hypothetical protein [Pseudoduganella violaceinigra]